MNFLNLKKLLGKFILFNFRLRIMFIFLLVLCLIGVIFSFYQKPDVRLCFMETPQHHSRQINDDGLALEKLDDILLAKIQPIPGKSIFFHETTCPQMDKEDQLEEGFHLNMVKLSARQACSIESTALLNPSTQIFVVFASPRYKYLNNTTNNGSTDAVLEVILSYDNVHLRNLNLWTYAANTPIYEWFIEGSLFKSRFVLSHISDFLRYLTLWRWGGTYLDLDIVMLKTMEKVPPNYTGAQSYEELAAGVMNFASDGFGHEITAECLQDFQRNFNGKKWGDNGPGVITRVMKQICETKNIKIMINSQQRCMGFKVYPRNTFYAIHYMEWEQYFDTQLYEQTMTRTRNSYVAHLWNDYSKEIPIKKGTKCAYSAMAEKHCPQVFQAAGEYF